jgi:small redox-active disulfide protein 2
MKTIKIEVIGSGCKKCKALFELTKEVAHELGITNEVEYSTDVTKIAAMGVMSSPVLAIDGKPVLTGVLPDREKLKTIISESISGDSKDTDKTSEEKTEEKKCEGCKCDGNC